LRQRVLRAAPILVTGAGGYQKGAGSMGASAGRVSARRGGDDGADGEQVDAVLDLRDVSVADYWHQIMAAVRTLDRGPSARPSGTATWRLLVQIGDTPEVAVELPFLLAHLTHLGIRHELTRAAAGGQRLLLARTG
jgi:hypothetical protein